jgi:RNA polymerase sigma factor (sigma-70 family)
MGSIKFSDAELLNGLLNRNEEVLREYYLTYYQIIRRFILTNNGTEEDAKDLFQDVLMVLFQKVRQENFKLTCSLGTYLYSVSRFLWLKELGKRKRVIKKAVDMEEFIDTETDIAQISDHNERLKIYRLYFEKLSADCRKVLTLFMEGRSIAEITVIMGYTSEQHTRNRRYRCKLALIESIRNKYKHEITGYENDQDN